MVCYCRLNILYSFKELRLSYDSLHYIFDICNRIKLTFLFYLAAWLEARGERKMQDINSGLMPFLIILCVVMLLIALQPDIGTMSIIVFSALMVYFIAGAPWLHMGILGGGGSLLFFLLI